MLDWLRQQLGVDEPRWHNTGKRGIGYLSRPSAVLAHWNHRDKFTLADAWEGVFAVGATGSGKSSGTAQFLALSYLRAGMGGLVLTAKASETATWEEYCHRTGRSRDLRIVRPGGPYRFNFVDHELQRPGAGAGHTENLVHLFAQVLQIADRGTSGSGRDEEGYWRRASQQLLRNALDLLILARGRVAVAEIHRVITTTAADMAEVRSNDWRATSFCFQCLQQADRAVKTAQQAHDFELVADFFLTEWPQLASKTRSVVLSTLSSMLDVIHRGVLHELYCTDTTLTPEDTTDGAVIVIDLPIKEYGQVGQLAQVLWKTSFQRAIERRDVRHNPRSVFLFADEAQYFVTSPWDREFQSTCRSSRVATVLLTQNLGNLQAVLGGGDRGQAETDSLLGNLNTKVLHANTDPVTNEWAASLIGSCRQFFVGASTQYQAETWLGAALPFSTTASTSASINEQVYFEVEPRRFTTLRRGGPQHRFDVDAIVFQGGRRFRTTRKTWLPVTFNQRSMR